MKLLFPILLTLSASAGFAQDSDERLNLVCLGAGSANRPDTATMNVQNNTGGAAWGSIVGNRSVPFEDQVNLWIEGDEGQLRMPRVMLPAIRGGDNGWFQLRDIEISEGEITAKVAVNIINRPNLRIDRYTGAISISGKAGNYVGECQAYDPDATERRF